MTSFRLLKYSSKDFKNENKQAYLSCLKKNSGIEGDLEDKEWVVASNSIKENGNQTIISFKVLKKVQREIITLSGAQEIEFVEEIPAIIFLEKNIIAIGKGPQSDVEDMRECIKQYVFDGKLKHVPSIMQSSEDLIHKLENDPTIAIIGLRSKQAMGVDDVRVHNRTEIRGKQIYDDAQRGNVVRKEFEKEYPTPYGKIKICIETNGLIVVFKNQLSADDSSEILYPLLDYFNNSSSFNSTLDAHI